MDLERDLNAAVPISRLKEMYSPLYVQTHFQKERMHLLFYVNSGQGLEFIRWLIEDCKMAAHVTTFR
jgi:hypothetical protein